MSAPSLDLAPNLTLPIDAVTQRIALLARTGAGKTYTAGVLVEEMLEAGAVVGVIDPLGVWWGLKSSADGRKEGYPVLVLGGSKGDLPLDPHAGKFLARWFCDARVSAVFNLSLFESEDEQRLFVAEFARELYRIKLAEPSPVHLVIDEADDFAPQIATSGASAGKSLAAIKNIVRRGRVAGIGTTLITQRSADIAKSVLSQTALLIALQTTDPRDLAAVEDWIRHAGDPSEAAQILKALPKMQPATGDAMVYSPGWLGILQRVQFRKKRTYDSSKTPKVGETLEPPRKLATVDLAGLAEEMKQYAEQAKADDPAVLRRRIAELEKLRPQVSGYSDADLARAVREAVAEADRRWLSKLQAPVHAASQAFAELRSLAGAIEAPDHIGRSTEGPLDVSFIAAVAAAAEPRGRKSHPPVVRRTPSTPSSRPSSNGNADFRILAVAAAFHPETLSDDVHGMLAGVDATKSTWRGSLGRLREAGFIQKGTPVRITAAGLKRAKDVPPIPKPGPELVAFWRGHVSNATARRMFDGLAKLRGGWATVDQMAEFGETDPSISTFRGGVGLLNKLNLIEISPDKRYRLKPAMFGK